MNEPKKEKKSKRSKTKYPALNKRLTSRVRQEFHDQDYIDQLNESEKEWLNRFIEEELNASFKNDDTDFNQLPEEKRATYTRNNARNRDLYGQVKNKVGDTKLLNYDNVKNLVEEHLAKEQPPTAMEDAYIDFIESRQIKAMMEEYKQAMILFNGERE